MSNFKCPTCGITNIDCGEAGYKTDREIELEKKLDIVVKALEEIKNAYIDLTTQDEYGSYYIDEAKLFVDIVGKIIKELKEID